MFIALANILGASMVMFILMMLYCEIFSMLKEYIYVKFSDPRIVTNDNVIVAGLFAVVAVLLLSVR